MHFRLVCVCDFFYFPSDTFCSSEFILFTLFNIIYFHMLSALSSHSGNSIISIFLFIFINIMMQKLDILFFFVIFFRVIVVLLYIELRIMGIFEGSIFCTRELTRLLNLYYFFFKFVWSFLDFFFSIAPILKGFSDNLLSDYDIKPFASSFEQELKMQLSERILINISRLKTDFLFCLRFKCDKGEEPENKLKTYNR